MKPPVTFVKNRYGYRLLRQRGRVLLYEQIHPKAGVVAYEVMIMRLWDKDPPSGSKLKGTPRLPSNEEFGTYGWSYQNLANAQEKFNELVSRFGKGVILKQGCYEDG